MNQLGSIFNLEYFYSLASVWMQELSVIYKAVIVEDKLMYFPEDMAEGSVYFAEVIPEISVVVFDLKFNQSFCFSRLSVKGEFWILYYNLSGYNSKSSSEDLKNKAFEDVNINFAVMDSRNEGSYAFKSGTSEFSLRILISKDFVESILETRGLPNNIEEMIDNELFFNGTIDSNSIKVLHDLKKHKLESPYYNLLVKSSTYSLLANFFENQSAFDFRKRNLIYERDREAVARSQEFLLSDLSIPFPGIEELVKIANMSVSKYRRLYKVLYGETPVAFFRKEKMLLAQKMLDQGIVKSLSEIAFALGYVNTSHFSQIYKRQFGSFPSLKNNK